jgi:pimeloyl-ACP methyl ester carboxylesterase
MLLITAATALAWFRQEYDVDIRTMAENAKAVSRDGTVIAFSRLGHGPPLILVDGAFCFRDNGPTPQLAPLLAQRFTVYVYDRRGRGVSGDTTPYAIEREVEDLGALLEAAGGSIHVMRIVMRSVWKKNESVAHTLPRDLAILDDWSVLKAGASIKIPVLIICGAKSPVEKQGAIKTVAESVPNSQRRMLEGQSHNVSMKVLAPALEEFFLAK